MANIFSGLADGLERGLRIRNTQEDRAEAAIQREDNRERKDFAESRQEQIYQQGQQDRDKLLYMQDLRTAGVQTQNFLMNLNNPEFAAQIQQNPASYKEQYYPAIKMVMDATLNANSADDRPREFESMVPVKGQPDKFMIATKVHKKDGTTYIAPMTQAGSSDQQDLPVVMTIQEALENVEMLNAATENALIRSGDSSVYQKKLTAQEAKKEALRSEQISERDYQRGLEKEQRGYAHARGLASAKNKPGKERDPYKLLGDITKETEDPDFMAGATGKLSALLKKNPSIGGAEAAATAYKWQSTGEPPPVMMSALSDEDIKNLTQEEFVAFAAAKGFGAEQATEEYKEMHKLTKAQYLNFAKQKGLNLDAASREWDKQGIPKPKPGKKEVKRSKILTSPEAVFDNAEVAFLLENKVIKKWAEQGMPLASWFEKQKFLARDDDQLIKQLERAERSIERKGLLWAK